MSQTFGHVAHVQKNFDLVLLESAARTAAVNVDDQANLAAVGLILVIDCTAVTATPGVTFTIQGKDPASGKYYTILASAAITGAGTTVLRVHPELTAAANTIAKDILPRTWRVAVTVADTDSATYSLGAILIS